MLARKRVVELRIVRLVRRGDGEWEPDPSQIVATVQIDMTRHSVAVKVLDPRYEAEQLRELFSKPHSSFRNSVVIQEHVIDAGLHVTQPWEDGFPRAVSDELFLHMGVACLVRSGWAHRWRWPLEERS
jgi:hypothetical protein